MARPHKTGLDYFPFDVDFFEDIKIRKLIKRQGGKAPSVYTLLLCLIYKNGYYIGGDKELPFIILEKTGFDEVYIRQVINDCFSLGLFNKTLYDEEKIITSKGIQIRYLEIQKMLKRKAVIPKYNLIGSEETGVITEETGVSSEETGVITEETGVSSELSTQRKEKKRKINPPSIPPSGEGRKEEENFNFYSIELPDDGVKRNYEGLLRELKDYRCSDDEIKLIVVLSDYGAIGGKVWRTLKEINPGIKMPGKFILSRLRT